MKITIDNYYKIFRGLDVSTLNDTFKKGHDFVNKATSDGHNWEKYHSNETYSRVIDRYFDNLSKFIDENKPKKKTVSKNPESEQTEKKEIKPSKTESEDIKEEVVYVVFMNKAKGFQEDKKFFRGKNAYAQAETWAKKEFEKFDPDFISYSSVNEMNAHEKQNKPIKVTSSTSSNKVTPNPNAEKVEVLSDSLKFIKRFINLHGKTKKRNQIRLFINSLQKAIRDRRIKKTSKHADEIMEIQSIIIKFHGQFENDDEEIEVDIPETIRVKYEKSIGMQVELISIKLIKSFIGLQGKIILNKQATNLKIRIENAIKKGKITSKDQYWSEIQTILNQLKTFITSNPKHGVIEIAWQALNGLEKITGYKGENFQDINSIPVDAILRSTDLSKIRQDSLGLRGKWLRLIGNATRRFTMMIFGKPKLGKSYLAVDFAGYLAQNHGKVLYVAREEGFDQTFRTKLKDKRAIHPDLYVTKSLPEDLEPYQFVFLDSVTRLGLSPSDLEALKQKYANKAFIYVFQSTKQGLFRGNNEFQHDVDSVVEVAELGIATQFGRFNQGGDMNIFEDQAA